MTLPSILSWNWSLIPLVIAIMAIAAHTWLSRNDYRLYKSVLFFAGVLIAEIALAIPLGPVPAGYSTSAFSCALPGGTLLTLHMMRHILLLLVAPPLLIAGLPEESLRHILSYSKIKPIAKKLSSPFIGGIVGVGTMWFWHVPPVYNYLVTYGAGFGHFALSIAEIASLVIAGAMLAWPVLSPLEEYRIHPLKGSVYLFISCVGCSILGMAIAFGATGYFHTAFASQPGTIWGLTQKTDQEMAGMLMWVPGCILYVTGAMVSIGRWIYQMEHPVHHKRPVLSRNVSASGDQKEKRKEQHKGIPHLRGTKTVTAH